MVRSEILQKMRNLHPNVIQKDMEKKAKQYKENQIKKVKEEVSQIRQEIDSKEKDILSKEASIKEAQ